MQFIIDVVLILVYFFAFFLICAWSWRFWVFYIQQKHISGINWILLEIKLPRDIFKSPLAMEIALSSLMQGGGIGPAWYKQFFLGNMASYASLEIASLEGTLHFYIRLQKKFRPLLEANLYAQYPGIEILEADDYTKKIRYHHLTKSVSAWGGNYSLSQKWKPTDLKTGKAYTDPKDSKEKYSMKADFLPIKTYVDYGLDKDPKEELKTDPITPLLEFMGSVGKGEYVWYQILIQDESVYNAKKTGESGKKLPKFFLNEVSGERFTLKEMAEARKNQIRKFKLIRKGDLAYDQQGNPIQKTIRGKDGTAEQQPVTYAEDREMQSREAELTVEEKNEIEAINKKISKPLALVVMRLMYVTKKENFNGAHVNDVLSILKPFAGVNSFAPSVTDPYDYPWQNVGGRRVAWRTEEKFDEYVRREGFFPLFNKRKSLDMWEDMFFWSSSMKTRKVFRLIYEIMFNPFETAVADQVSVLNMEELATLWHFPGAVAGTPTLPRIDSTKGVAPVNLPR